MGYTGEEWKMVRETHKILEDDSIRMSTTTVRVPVFRCHSEAVNIETEQKITPHEVRQLLTTAPGVVVIDEPEKSQYPMPTHGSRTRRSLRRAHSRGPVA